ncbi:HNH endonuclease signature motif containing protein [Anatilimnocola floriformis]|uniref:HNH endonuclease signature motif containing protein n=1 Tax=Anatilimnocola floriformis TaxID=2948575 RepID=UPI0036F2C704
MPNRAPRFQPVTRTARSLKKSDPFYSSRRWVDETRPAKLALNPWCECGCGRLAQEVHHIIPKDVCPDPHAISNLMSLTKSCHSRITATQRR